MGCLQRAQPPEPGQGLNESDADFGTIVSKTGNRTMQIGWQYAF